MAEMLGGMGPYNFFSCFQVWKKLGILLVKLLLIILLHMAQNGKKVEQNTNPKDCPSMKILKLLLEHLWASKPPT